mgnify:CR=1 FL=1|tara:strand:- start:4725 stop:5105 length:381 start_codon:yes stop_codon:yes gene_type:complete
MSFSDYLENKVLAYVFSGTAFTQPGTKYLALYTSAPSDAGGGTEVSGNGYARQSIAFTTTNNQSSNTSAVEFPTATASWGTITHIGVFDASTSGNLLAWAALAASKTIASGDVFRVNAGELDIDLT